MRRTFRLAVALAALLSLAGPAGALTVPPAPDLSAGVTPVAEGCGPGRWRGPWGGCRGPEPGWAWHGPAYPGPGWYGGNGCPPGFWRGPWGHCRDTPYHGPLPGGGWK
jgi:hypothetical protein